MRLMLIALALPFAAFGPPGAGLALPLSRRVRAESVAEPLRCP